MHQIIRYIQSILAFSKIELKKMKAYSGQLSSLLLTLPIKAILTYLIWANLSTYNYSVDLQWLVLYSIIVSFMEFITMPYCEIAYNLMQDIHTGDLDMYIVKPIHYLWYRFISKLHIFFLFVIVMIPLKIVYKVNIFSFHNISILYFYIISVSYIYIIFAMVGILSFKFENILTLRDNIWNIIRLLAGSILPLSYYPFNIEKILKFLPFEYIYYKPVIFTQNVALPTSFDFVISGLWLILGIFLLIVFWNGSIRHYSSQGG